MNQKQRHKRKKARIEWQSTLSLEKICIFHLTVQILNILVKIKFGLSTEVWVEHFAGSKLCLRGRTLGAIKVLKVLPPMLFWSDVLWTSAYSSRGRTLGNSTFPWVQMLLLSKFGHSLNQTLHGWGRVAGQTHPRPKGATSTGVGPTWGHGCMVWFGLL